MSQFQTTNIRPAGGGIDVFTGLLAVAVIVLAAGVALLALRNIEHSKAGTQDSGGPLTLVDAG